MSHVRSHELAGGGPAKQVIVAVHFHGQQKKKEFVREWVRWEEFREGVHMPPGRRRFGWELIRGA